MCLARSWQHITFWYLSQVFQPKLFQSNTEVCHLSYSLVFPSLLLSVITHQSSCGGEGFLKDVRLVLAKMNYTLLMAMF